MKNNEFIKRKKRNSFCLDSSETVLEIRDFLLIITVWGESGKVILQVSIAVFFGRCQKIFGAKMAQSPWK